MRLALALVAAAIALPASAQTTRCGMEFGKWVCRVDAPREQPDIVGAGQRAFDQAYQRGEQQRAQREAAQAQARESSLAVERERSEAAMIVDRYISAGRCDDAARVAVEYFGTAGELDARNRCK